MKKTLIILFLFLLFSASKSQTTLKVLFLGNSYTSVNDLPGLTSLVTKSAGDSLIYSSNTPGGYTFNQHSTNATSITLINQGGWDYVVLQEQSQLPSFTDPEVQSMVFPYATTLDNMIHAADSCTETIFYMTWGRKNGDALNCAAWPPVCTYEGMDSLLHLRYMMMAEDNNAEVSPVGAVWHYLRQNAPGIELYNADESHPSQAGSYAAACTFYTSMFRKSPLNITYDYSLSAGDANTIRNAVKTVVFDSLANWYIGSYNPVAAFTAMPDFLDVTFTNNSSFANNNVWSFGDGDNSTLSDPIHTYSAPGTYPVSLIASACGLADTITQTVTVIAVSIDDNEAGTAVYPNPVEETLIISCDFNIISVEILDVTGKHILAKTLIESGQATIDFSQVVEGTYFISIETAEGMVVRKVVKK